MPNPLRAASIPPSLLPLKQWVLWRYVVRDGKPTKAPFQPSGWVAKSNDPATWVDFESAVRAFERGGFDGVGFVFAKDGGLVGVDLDWKDWAGEGVPLKVQTIVNRLNSYTEWSPSRKGCHILLKGKRPAGIGKKEHLAPGVGLEVYDSGRFFTVTGERWEGYPADLEERQAELEALLAELFPPRERKRPLPEPPPPPPREVRIGGSPRRLTALLGAYAEAVRSAQQGTRHNTLIGYARAAGGLVPHGLDPQEAEEALVAAALEAGLPEAEARAAVRWGLEVGRSHPLYLEDAHAYQPSTYRARVYKRLRRWV